MARVMLYDADCGFCTRVASLAVRIGCEVEPIAWQQWSGLAARGITPEAAAAALHLVDGDRILIGHEAVAGTLLRNRHAGWRLVGRILLAPVVRHLSRRAYAVVAHNRHRLPGSTDSCRLEPERKTG